jgi:hypothetical protein
VSLIHHEPFRRSLVALPINVAIYIVVGTVFVSQASWNRPAIFRNEIATKLAGWLPMAGFVGLPIAGFLFHNSPWWFLAADIGVVVAFAVRPSTI